MTVFTSRGTRPDRTAQGSLLDSRLDRALTRVSGAPLRTGNSITLLHNGPATFDDWLNAIAGAQRWVHLENYIFKGDAIGQRFAAALIERAQAGVAVRVIYDWFGSWDVPLAFWERLRRGGVDVRAINSLAISAPLSVINRDHRKFVGVDGAYASIGGVCIDDHWLQTSPITGLPYRDTAVRITGPAIADLESAFADVWARTGKPLPHHERVLVNEIAPTGDMAARVIVEEPGRMRMLSVLQMALAIAEQRIWIADAYFLAVPTLREALMVAARDGLDVRILLPASNDLPVVAALSRAGYRPLLEAGVRIWEYAGLMMHAKTSVGDARWARVGSTNLNVTGLLTNWEIDVLVQDARFGAEMEAMYEDDLQHAREIRLRGSARHRRPQPARAQSRAEKQARHDQQGSAPASTMVARLGAALQTARDDDLQQSERTLAAAVGGAVLGVSLLSMRFPRIIAAPLATLGTIFGGLTLVRAARTARPQFNIQPPRAWRRSALRFRLAGRRRGRVRLPRRARR